MQRFSGLVFAAAVGCAGTQQATRAPSPADPSATRAADSRSASPAPEPAPRATSRPADSEAPAPLRAGSGGGYTPERSSPKSECAPDAVRKKLQQVVGECKKSSDPICGELKVRASEDGKSVRVTLDVSKQSFDDSFSRCVTSRMNAVEWHCTLPGSDVTLDLGCDF